MYIDSPGITALAERNICYSRLREKALPPEADSPVVHVPVKAESLPGNPRNTPGESPGEDKVETVLSMVAEKGRILVAAGSSASSFADSIGHKEMAERIRAATKTVKRGTDAVDAAAGCWKSGKVLINPTATPEKKKEGVTGFVTSSIDMAGSLFPKACGSLVGASSKVLKATTSCWEAGQAVADPGAPSDEKMTKINNGVFTVFVAMGTLFPTVCGTAMVTAGTFGLAGTEVINKLCHRQ